MTDMHREALDRLLAYGRELEIRDYRAALSNWQRELDAHMAKRPVDPEALRYRDEQEKEK